MLNYIIADFKRIFVRVSRIVATVIIIALMIWVSYLTRESGGLGFLNVLKQILTYLPVPLGVIELLAIFSDDFKAKSMQIAIGCGLGRNRVILSKWIQFVIFSVMDWVCAVGLTIICANLFGNKVPAVVIGEIAVITIHNILKNVTVCAYVGITVFLLQSITAPMILFIILSTGFVESIVKIASMNPKVATLHLESRTPLGMVNYAQAHVTMGMFPVFTYICIALYIALGLVLTMALFKKRELEF